MLQYFIKKTPSIILTLRRTILSLIVANIFCLNYSIAQNSKPLTLSLKKALAIAEDQNWEINKAISDINIAKASLKESNAFFHPNIRLSESYINTNNPLNTFGIKLKQENVTQNDFNPELLNAPSNITNYTTKLKIEQPLVNPEGIYLRKAMKDQLTASELKINRTKKFVAYSVKKNYLMIKLLEKKLTVLEKTLESAKANYEIAKNNLKEGYLKKEDILLAELRVLDVENQINETRNQIITNEDQLAFMLGYTEISSFNLTDELDLFKNNIPIKATTDLLEQRDDLKAYRLEIKSLENSTKAIRKSLIPTLNGFGSYEFNDNTIFGTQASNYLIGAKLNWNIYDGSRRISGIQKKKAQLEKTKIAYKQYLVQNRNEILNAERSILLSKQKMLITIKSIAHASESLRVKKNRYQQGLEKTADLVQAESVLAQKELEYLNTLYQYITAGFLLEYLSQ